MRIRFACVALALASGLACTTDDVDIPPPDDRELYPIVDDAFGEYLAFLNIEGVVENEALAASLYSIDVAAVSSVTELSLSKTSSAVTELMNAGVRTAEDKITNLDGLQFFTGLQVLTLTSNAVTTLDASALTQLTELAMNFNLVGDLDLRSNTALEVLRYRASSDAGDDQKLSTIDLSNNTQLVHLFLPGHNLTAIDLTNNTDVSEVLDLSDNPGPDGDPSTEDIVVPDAIYNAVPSESRAGVIPESLAPVQLSLVATPSSLEEGGGTVTLRARLNRAAEEAVSLDLLVSGTATEGVDFTLSGTSLSIVIGETESAPVTLTALDDSNEEGGETIVIEATNIVGAQGATTTITIPLTDDDGVLTIMLNEVLYDPPDEIAGDANGDGGRDPDDDEFIEIVNIGTETVDLSGIEVYDSDALTMGTPRHVIDNGTTLAPNQGLVVFGGGTPTGSFGGSVVQTANGFENRLNLNNGGDILTVQRPSGLVLLTFDVEPLSNNPNESYTRVSDLDPNSDFVQHAELEEGVLFSPGTRADGTSF